MKLNVALYGWGRNEYLDQHRLILEHYWYNVLDNKEIHLNWIEENEWDGGYHKNPEEYFDVFIYDAIFIDYYISQGWLSALDRDEITYAEEIDSKILSLIECPDGKYYGIPIYGCMYVLFYRSNDRELASIKTFEDLLEIASKRAFIMRKPGERTKKSNYILLLDPTSPLKDLTENDLDMNLIQQLSHFYRYSKSFLTKNDRYSFEQLSFYIGYTEDINTMVFLDENDLAQIDCMFVPTNHPDRAQCWLDCVGIHPCTKLRGTYEKSLQLANLMTCSEVMNACLNGRFYLLPTNHRTFAHLASNNSIYAKLQTMMNSHLFRPLLSVPMVINSSRSRREQWTQNFSLITSQHQKEMQSMADPSTAAS